MDLKTALTMAIRELEARSSEVTRELLRRQERLTRLHRLPGLYESDLAEQGIRLRNAINVLTELHGQQP